MSTCPAEPIGADVRRADQDQCRATTWTNSGLTGTFTNIANGTVLNQTVPAFSCVVPATSVKVTKAATP